MHFHILLELQVIKPYSLHDQDNAIFFLFDDIISFFIENLFGWLFNINETSNSHSIMAQIRGLLI